MPKIFTLALAVLAGFSCSRGVAIAAPEELNHAELLKSRQPREVIWTFDSSMFQYNLTVPDESKISGIGGAFAIGYGRSRANSWLTGRFHFLAGPWDTARNGAFDADYSGSMIDVEYGTSFPGTDLRRGSVPILTISAGYMDLTGKNIGDNRKNNGDPNNRSNYYLEQNFKTSLGAVVITPGIGWAWAKPARPTGNEPDLLVTRVESAFAKFGALVPLYSRSRVEIGKRDQSDPISKSPSTHTSSGHVRGYSFVASAGVWLGI